MSDTDSSSFYTDSGDEEDEIVDVDVPRERSSSKGVVAALEERGDLDDFEAARLMNTDDLSSDDEEEGGGASNTIGRVPLHWYDAYDHIGYDVSGKKLMKRSSGKSDRIDVILANRDDESSRRTVYDMYNDREVVLSERDMEIIRRVQAGALAHPEHDDTPDYSDYFSSIREIMPISAAPDPKKKFEPSKWEMLRVLKIVKAMKEGKYVSQRRGRREEPQLLTMWDDSADEVLAESSRNKFHLPAPKMPLPGHAESYNPPPEVMRSTYASSLDCIV